MACAAANATLDLFENNDVIENNKKTAAYMYEKLQKFQELKQVSSIRQTGMICALDITGFDPKERIGLKVYSYGLQNGVLLRPLGSTIYFMPPYIITNEEIDKMFEVAYEAISQL